MPSLHLLQISLVYVNTLTIQRLFAEPEWRNRLTAVDRPIADEMATCNPYGTFTLKKHARASALKQMAQLPRATLPKFGLRYLRAYNW